MLGKHRSLPANTDHDMLALTIQIFQKRDKTCLITQ